MESSLCISRVFSHSGLPQLLSWLFLKMLVPMVDYLHFRNMSIFQCINDIFHAHDTRIQSLSTTESSIRLHLQLGPGYSKPSEDIPCSLAGDDITRCEYRHVRWFLLRPVCSRQDPADFSGHPFKLLGVGYAPAQQLQGWSFSWRPFHTTVSMYLFRFRLILSHLSRNFKCWSDNLSKASS